MFNKPLILSGTGVTPVYKINQSIRFDSSANAHMDRTPSSAGNQKTWTFSCWVKRGKLGSRQFLFTAFNGNNNNTGMNIFRFQADDTLNWAGYSLNWRRTTQVFRDTSAWYHIVLSVDTTNPVGSERQIIYVNGERVTDFADSSDMAEDYAYSVNNTVAHAIGIGLGNQSSYDFDGYMAEIVFLDGTATDCNSFGEFNSSGIWIPKNIYNQSFTFGTNGFYLTGQNADYLGYDYQTSDRSGTPNDWTVTNIASHDQVLDSPTNNFAVYNILYNVGDVDFPTYSEGNLSVDFNYFGKRSPVSTFALPTDSDAYCEFYIKTSGASNNTGVGIGQGDANNTGNVVLTNGVTYNLNGNKTTGGSFSSFGNTYTAGDIIGVYFDQSDNEVDFYKNNTLEGSISLSSLSGDLFFLVANNTTSQQVIIANFGQDDTFAGNKTSGSAGSSDASGNGKFYYSRISDAKALCSKSLGS